MALVAVYPGTFDPITNGHSDLIKRGCKIFDKIIVAVAENPQKNTLFNIEERVGFIKEIYDRCVEENKKPVTKIKNLVKEIYKPFNDNQISSKISTMLKEVDINADVVVIYQSIKNLHLACPNDLGDWYFSGNYPTNGGNKVVNQAYINYFEGSNKRAY